MGKTNDVMMWSTVRQERKKEKKSKETDVQLHTCLKGSLGGVWYTI